MQDFNFHQHTYRCRHADMDYSDEDYVKESINNNLRAICFTDHSPSFIDKRNNMRMKYYDKYEYLDSINYLKEKYKDKIDIYKGYEVEYTSDNIKDLEIFNYETDILILGQHFIENDDKVKIVNYEKYTDEDIEIYTETIEKALDTGYISILAHPDLIMRARNKFGKKEEEMAKRICIACEKNDIPLEINLNKVFANTYFDYKNKVLNEYKDPDYYIDKLEDIKYPNKKFWEIVSNYNVKVLYGIDTHYKGQISLFKEMIELANFIIGKETINKLSFCTMEDIIKKEKVRTKK